MRPLSIFDDIVTTVRYALARWGVSVAASTPAEAFEKTLHPELRMENIRAETNPEILEAKIQSYDLYRKRHEAKQRQELASARRMAMPRIRFKR